MICNRPLTTAEMASSQRNYLLYNGVNGASYMCLGETVLILFAVKLHCSDTVVAILGGMIFFGFLLLPLGKIMTARVGAARSQADFWVMRNIAALVVAAAAPAALFLSPLLATVMLIGGAFLFYGFRAAGVVMGQPLVGEICEKNSSGKFVAKAWVYFYTSGVTAIAAIALCMKFNESVWMLFAIIISGTILGITSSTFMRKVHETGEIRKNAQRPLLREIPGLLRDKVVMRQLIAGMICNMSTVLLVPISMLSLKRGYGVADGTALFYSLVQFGSCIGISLILAKVADRFGGRKLTIAGFYANYAVIIIWLLLPVTFHPLLAVMPFVICPLCSVISSTALTQYFIHTVPPKDQVAASLLIAVGTGVFAGLPGMILSSLFLKWAAMCNSAGPAIMTYKYYFTGILFLLPLMSLAVHALYKEDKLPSKIQ
ncbi:MAG: MFS transporter [Lentisphaerae bacterium]|nr:MFS transporter [Lentisphaerota bacterium]